HGRREGRQEDDHRHQVRVRQVGSPAFPLQTAHRHPSGWRCCFCGTGFRSCPDRTDRIGILSHKNLPALSSPGTPLGSPRPLFVNCWRRLHLDSQLFRAQPASLECLERPRYMTVDLDRQLKALRAGDHLCLIYDDPAQQLAALVPFIKEGMTRGERCVCSTVEQGSAEVAQALSAAGVDVEHERQRGALQLWTARDIYLASGKFDPQGMIAFLRELTEQTVAAGYPALRITGEMTWALGPEPGCDRLIEYESLLNHFIPRAPVLALCR